MRTITKEFTKEQLQQIIETDHVQCGEASALARIALASLEAEVAGFIVRHKGTGNFGSWLHSKADWFKSDEYEVLRAYTAPPAPVSVPDEVLKRLLPDAEKAEFWFEHDGKILFEGVKFNNAVFEACRAAMLQGAEPVTTANKLLDGWVACSERMPEDDDFVYIWPRPDFGVELHVGQYCECHPKGDGWYAQVYEQNYGIEWCPITVTHWMPLPAAPQQEVTQALAKGMERYGDAMQKLADSGD